MPTTPILAVMYDFDRTLSPRDMQEYAFIPHLGLTPAAFWEKCEEAARAHHMDPILAYMWIMLRQGRGKTLLNREELVKLGRTVELFPGVDTWFRRINAYAAAQDVSVEHYIISSGLREIIEGTAIAHEFKRIFAAEFVYDEDNVPVWPAMAVNYTSKTQFLFRINKGVLDVNENAALNEFMPDDRRRIPFRNMVYIGDGLTDVPCMKLTRTNGGFSIAVHDGGDMRQARDMIAHGRVDFVLRADYSEGSEMEQTLFEIVDRVKATHVTVERHMAHLK